MSSYTSHRTKKAATQAIQDTFAFLKNMTLAQWVVLVVAGAVMSLILVMNWQPWLLLGTKVAESITSVPFLGWLTGLWLIGPAIQALTQNTAQLIGLILWAGCQIVQSIPLMLMAQRRKVPGKIWWLYAASYVCELSVTMLLYPIYGDGLGDFLGDFLRWDPYYCNPDEMLMFIATFASFEMLVGIASCLIVKLD